MQKNEVWITAAFHLISCASYNNIDEARWFCLLNSKLPTSEVLTFIYLLWALLKSGKVTYSTLCFFFGKYGAYDRGEDPLKKRQGKHRFHGKGVTTSLTLQRENFIIHNQKQRLKIYNTENHDACLGQALRMWSAKPKHVTHRLLIRSTTNCRQ